MPGGGVVARADLRLDVLKDHPNGPELPKLVGTASEAGRKLLCVFISNKIYIFNYI